MRANGLCVVLGIAATVSLFSVAAMAQNVDVSFSCVTFNNAADATAGQTQLSATLSKTGDSAGDIVYLAFDNRGPAPCSITRVYIAGYAVSALNVGSQSAGVSFLANAKGPRNLPGGNTIGFLANLVTGAKAPVQPNGVNPGESLVLVLRRPAGISPSAILAAVVNGSIRIGIHVQGFAGDGSESFVGVPKQANPDE